MLVSVYPNHSEFVLDYGFTYLKKGCHYIKMDIESARKKLDNIGGYVHPENASHGKTKNYKVFDDTDTKAKNDIKKFKTITVDKKYGTYDNIDITSSNPNAQHK